MCVCVYMCACFKKTSTCEKVIDGRDWCWLSKQSIEPKRTNKHDRLHTLFTDHRARMSIDVFFIFVLVFLRKARHKQCRKRWTNAVLMLFRSYMYMCRKNTEKFQVHQSDNEWKKQTRKEEKTLGTRRCTLRKEERERDRDRNAGAHDYFLGTRADDDRPVSVPVARGCLELVEADCGGGAWIGWVSFGVRRYTPRRTTIDFDSTGCIEEVESNRIRSKREKEKLEAMKKASVRSAGDVYERKKDPAHPHRWKSSSPCLAFNLSLGRTVWFTIISFETWPSVVQSHRSLKQINKWWSLISGTSVKGNDIERTMLIT